MRNVVTGILYVLATGCQWKAMPREFGSGSAIHAYFQEWVELGVFEELWRLALGRVRRAERHRLEVAEHGRGDDQIAAGWGKKPGKTRPIAASWASSARCSIDGRGVPLAVAVDGANVPDQKLVAETFDGIPIERPSPTPRKPQHLCLDKGYIGEPVDREVRQRGYTPHVPRKGNEPRSRNTAAARPAVGKSNARTPGSTAPGDC